MTNWQSELTPEERERLETIKAEQRALSHERRQIYDRARKRLLRA